MSTTPSPYFTLGQGTISGWISATLGILALCGVACFYFPQHLTSAEFRAKYSLDVMRWLMLVALCFSYLLGLVSYVLSSSKWLSAIGIGTSLLASILGGSRIEVGDFESTPYSFGLDWFVISFLFSMLILIPLERAFALRPLQPVLRSEWRTDVAYFFVSHLGIQYILLFVNGVYEVVFGGMPLGTVATFVRELPVWLQFLMCVFVADLGQYITHRLCHNVPFLWRFHSIHHSCETMDWLAGSRLHVVEVFVVRALVMLPLYLIGFSEGALNAYIVLVGIQSVIIHANVNWNFGPLRYVLATPQFHHWHHAKDRHYSDANYAVHLPLIDLLFGTFRCPKNEWPTEYGVVSEGPPQGFWRQLLHPFVKR